MCWILGKLTKEMGLVSYGGVLYVKLIGEVGVVVDMSLAAFVVCMCERVLAFGKRRSEKGGSG